MSFDHAQVIIPNIDATKPVFHRAPMPAEEEGWRGDIRENCNAVVYRATGQVIGNNSGQSLPEQVVSPCGLEVFRRNDSDPAQTVIEQERAATGAPTRTHNPARMVRQGTLLPKGHAEKFARPCKRCFP